MTQRLWTGYYYGGNLGFLNYEILTIQNIPHKDFAGESILMEKKWFDYRLLHPMQATYFFVQQYTVAFREFCRMAINHETAQFTKCIKGNDFLESREKMSFWRLRQLCDSLGMPYDFFLGFVMRRHYKTVCASGKIYPPRPNHILGNADLVADAMIAWEEMQRSSLQIACDPYYHIANYTGSSNQQAHQRFVIDQIKSRTVKRFALNAALYVHDAVSYEEAVREFGVDLVNEALKYHEAYLPS